MYFIAGILRSMRMNTKILIGLLQVLSLINSSIQSLSASSVTNLSALLTMDRSSLHSLHANKTIDSNSQSSVDINGSSDSYSTVYNAMFNSTSSIQGGKINYPISLTAQIQTHTLPATSSNSIYPSSYVTPVTSAVSRRKTPSLSAASNNVSASMHLAAKSSNISNIASTTYISGFTSFVVPTSSLLPSTLWETVASPASSVIPTCVGCSGKKSDKNFKYIIMGVAVGAAFVFFFVIMVVAYCNFKQRERRKSRIYVREDFFPPEKASDELLESKESVFNSSTLHMNRSAINQGMEMDDGFLRIQPGCSTANDESQTKHTSFYPPEDKQPESVHYSPQQVNLDSTELFHGARLRLLQDWKEELSDNKSEEFKQLKSDVEESINDIYKTEEGFKNAEVHRFWRGSVIADFALIFFKVVHAPLHMLEKSVAEGRIGHLNVDKSFSVVRSSEPNSMLIHNDATDFESRQPYMQNNVSQMEKHNIISNSDNSNDNNIEITSFQPSSEPNSPTIRSVATVEITVSQNIQSCVLENQHETRRITSLSEETNTESADIAQRPASLIDLRKVDPPVLRNHRDSGIGSMQELSKVSVSRASIKGGNAEDTEQVFYDIPESYDNNKAKDPSKLEPLSEQGIAYVAVYDFSGKDNRELKMKQGEVLHVIQSDSLGWMKVVNSDNQRGWVPTSFLVQVSRSQLTSTQETVETLEFLDNVLEQLDEESESEASTTSTPFGEEYLTPVDNDEDKHEYVTLIPEENSLIHVHRCKSVYEFEANDHSEMSFTAGKIIDVLKTTDVGWWKGRTDDGEGWFPSSYVLPLHEQSDVGEEKNSMGAVVLENQQESADRDYHLYDTTHNYAEAQISEDKVIYVDPENISEQKGSKYESLKKPFVPSESYAHLYLQILKRESKNEEQLEHEIEQMNITTTQSDPERPLRVAPIPPREEGRERPVIPARKKNRTPFLPKSDMNSNSNRKPLSTHGEPPQRPVPPPPTAKPSLMHKPIVQSEQCSDVIFIGKDVAKKTSAAGKTAYENLPEKPKHSPEFMKRENIKHPIAAVSLSSLIEGNQLAERGKEVSNSNNMNTNTASSELPVTVRPVLPNKPTPPIRNSSSVSSPMAECKPRQIEMNESKELLSKESHSPVEIKPTKPLPKLDQSLTDSETSTSLVTLPESDKVKSKIESNVQIASNKLSVSREGHVSPVPSVHKQATKPTPPTKATPKLIKEDSANTKQGKTDQTSPSTGAGNDIMPLMKANSAMSESYASTDPIKSNLKDVRSEPTVSSKLEVSEDSHNDTHSQRSSKPQIPFKPQGFAIRKEDLLSKKKELDHNEFSEFVNSGSSEMATRSNNFKLSQLVNGQGKKASQMTESHVDKASSPFQKQDQAETSKEHSDEQEGARIDHKTNLGTSSSDQSRKPGLKPTSVVDKPLVYAKPKDRQIDSSSAPRVKVPLPSKASIDRTASPEGNPVSSKVKAIPQKPLPPTKATSKHVSSSQIKHLQNDNVSSPKEVKPVPAQRAVKNEKVNKNADESITNTRSDDCVKISRSLHNTKSREVDNSASRNAPVPAPRKLVSSPQTVHPKMKPERPLSPPSHGLVQQGKPARPPPPAAMPSKKHSSPGSVTKDTTKLRRVIKSYSKSSNKELNLVVGNMLFELASEDDRCYGLLENGEEGWYPTDHVVAVCK